MSTRSHSRRISRRELFRLGGGLAAAAGLSGLGRQLLRPTRVAQAAELHQPITPDYHLVGTDGWIHLPPRPGGIRSATSTNLIYHPDDLAPAPFNTYMFGFRNVTGLSDPQIQQQRGWAQSAAPALFFDEGQNHYVKLTNLGLSIHPDLTDPHTLHWHGFRNAIPMFDGEPTSSVSVPIGRSLLYFYKPLEAGTYMYHCHVEDTEHVHMGMTGLVFVRPAQNGNTALYPSGKYVYNDNNGSTGYDREYVMLLSEVWGEAHWADSHIQLPDWTNYAIDFAMLNGRVYPDTLAPSTDPLTDSDANRLRYQPLSSLVRGNSGERVLLRFANLGFTIQSMTVSGLKMRVVGKDATPMRGSAGADASYLTNTISIGPGESLDVIIELPQVSSPQTFLLYNRAYSRLHSGGAAGLGGQMTEIRVSPSGIPTQTTLNG